MSVYVVCYDIEDDGIRVQLSRLLGEYGERVQRSVFEITLRSEQDRVELQARLTELLGEEREVRFYCLCERCRTASYSLAGEKVAVFPSAIIV
ncbi:MAG: CRISPR-associated endonuclease Cas2 [Candidatus Competibacteraceae bacterium]